MTCDVAREQLSAFLDDALDVSGRQALDAHLTQCAECRRELEQLRATVAFLGRLPAVHAPAGFVDRVMAAAARPPWPRRLLDVLFRPLRVKVPLEAAALLVVGVSALYVYQHTPEVQQLARQESRESSQAPAVVPSSPAASPPAGLARQPAGSGEEAYKASQAPGEREAERPKAAPQPQSAVIPPGAPIQAVPGTPERSVAAPLAKPEPKAPVQSALKKEAEGERSEATGAASPPGSAEKVTRAAEPAPRRDAASAPTPGPFSSSETVAPQAATPPATPEAGGRAGSLAAPAPAPAHEGAATDALSGTKSKTAARLMRAVDASGRLVVPARGPAEVALDALLTRLGATRVARRLDDPQGPVLIDVVVPAARYGELVEGLGRIGRWTTEHEPRALPAQVRLEVAISEP